MYSAQMDAFKCNFSHEISKLSATCIMWMKTKKGIFDQSNYQDNRWVNVNTRANLIG